MINIILLGANYYGEMAPSQRVYNLFSPLVKTGNITLHNIVYAQDKSLICDNQVAIIYPKGNNKILKHVGYVHLSRLMIQKWYAADRNNIIYYFGSPSIENFIFLSRAKRMGYKIVFDIVENIYAHNSKKASLIHCMLNLSKLFFVKYLAKIGDLCFGISDALVALCKQLTKEQIPVLLLPISVDVEKVCSYKNDVKNADEIAVFYGGSFGQKDGIAYLIEGFTRAWQQDKRLKLYLTGKIAKESAGELEQYIMQSDAKEAIQYLGCLPTEAYYDRMANSDILCMLRVNSVFANSGFPFKLGEYLASGNAVIATRTSDIEKYLTHKQNAYLIKPEDSELIAEAILALAGDEALRKKIGTAGQMVAKENFDANKVSMYMINEIKQIV